MSRILFVTDELPFPPRSGVTIPSYHMMSGLSKHHEVSLLFLKSGSRTIDNDQLEANRLLVRNLWVLEVQPISPIISSLKELFRLSPTFACNRFDYQQCADLLRGYDCDLFWATPIGPSAQLPHIEKCLPPHRIRLRIAAISDSYTATLREYGRQVLGSKWNFSARIRSIVKWLRSWGMAPMERKILSNMHCILVQSAKDKEWVSRISNGALSQKVTILPNGVSFGSQTQPTLDMPTVGHVGALSASAQARTVRWMLEEVFPLLLTDFPTVRFALLGKPGAKALMDTIHRTDHAVYIPHVDSMEEFYHRISVLVVWNYKSIGVINRTLEAMAAGIVVVGEPGAFNGIQGFQHGKHGFIARTNSEAVHFLKLALGSKTVRETIGKSARELVGSSFKWTDRVHSANLLIHGLTKNLSIGAQET